MLVGGSTLSLRIRVRPIFLFVIAVHLSMHEAAARLLCCADDLKAGLFEIKIERY